MERHEGKTLDDLFHGETCETSQGSSYRIEDSIKFKFKCINKYKAKTTIIRDLKLINGIGDAKECKLKSEGYETIEDLLEHPSYSSKASELLNKLDESPLTCISECYSASNPNRLFSSSYRAVDDFVFFDIETLGLKDRPVILIGMARIEEGNMKITQYLATRLDDEKHMLSSFISNTNSQTVFVSFNGRSFDLPFIRSRARIYRIPRNLNQPHLDLLHFSRRTWRDHLPNCRLQTIEQHLFNMERHEDVPSSHVPAFYNTYLNTGNIGPLVPIVEHNKQDVITLARIMSRLQDEIV
ncbi:MAG TPA: ribonuclease H-like domain-containing protein [Methanobacterium sp.]|nr:ribonuclease H-like domain-containing protein [Methanobacterium sp.]